MMETHNKANTPRKKTEGEKQFDWWIYGGIGWVVNALLSVVITDQLYNNKTPLISTKEGKISIKQWFQNGENWLKNQSWNLPEKWFPNISFTKKAVFGGSLCIGGSLVVPVIKWFEDHKGSIVRKWDEKIYGARANNDPDIIKAHHEMDNAPQQSWLSLLGARITVIAIAFGMGPTIGDYNSVSGKALGKVPVLRHFSSFEGFGGSCARLLGRAANFFSKEKPLMNEAVAMASPLKVITEGPQEEHRALKVAEITGYELTQSASIAALFYVISKAFSSLGSQQERTPRHIPTSVTFDSGARRKKEEATLKPEPKPQNTVSEVAQTAKIDPEKPKSGPQVAA